MSQADENDHHSKGTEMETLLAKLEKENEELKEDYDELVTALERLRTAFTYLSWIMVSYGVGMLFVLFSLLRKK